MQLLVGDTKMASAGGVVASGEMVFGLIAGYWDVLRYSRVSIGVRNHMDTAIPASGFFIAASMDPHARYDPATDTFTCDPALATVIRYCDEIDPGSLLIESFANQSYRYVALVAGSIAGNTMPGDIAASGYLNAGT